MTIASEVRARVITEPLDFALFATDRAVSFFRHEGGRRFIARFAGDGKLPENDSVIKRQRDVYSKLLREVWLVTEGFGTGYLGHDDVDFRGRLQATMNARNAALRAAGVSPQALFPFVVAANGSTHDELIKMKSAYDGYNPSGYRDAGRLTSTVLT